MPRRPGEESVDVRREEGFRGLPFTEKAKGELRRLQIGAQSSHGVQSRTAASAEPFDDVRRVMHAKATTRADSSPARPAQKDC